MTKEELKKEIKDLQSLNKEKNNCKRDLKSMKRL